MKSYQQKEQSVREEHAKNYDARYIRAKGILFDTVERDIFDKYIDTSGKILDLGCGTGRLCEQIARKSNEIYACDFSYQSLEVLKDKNVIKNDHIFFQDITQRIDFPEGFFDCTYSCQVIQHLQIDDLMQSLEQVKRVLKRGGKFIFSVYNKDCYMFENYEEMLENGLYLKRFNKRYIKYLCKHTGFKIKKIKYYSVNPILHKSSSKVNLYLEYLLEKIPFINRLLGKYLFVVLEK